MDALLYRLGAVAVGGAIGSVGRYLAVVGCARLLGDRFAYGVLAVNVVGCLLIGLLIKGITDHGLPLSQNMQLAIGVGLLGGLTTFSSFGYDTFTYLDQGRWAVGVFNVLGNLLLGLGACWLGTQLAPHVFK